MSYTNLFSIILLLRVSKSFGIGMVSKSYHTEYNNIILLFISYIILLWWPDIDIIMHT